MCLIGAIAGTGLAAGLSSAIGISTTAAAWGVVGAGVALATGKGSTIAGVTSSIQQGNAQQAMYNYKAQIELNNAGIAQQNAGQERQAGIEDARMQRLKAMQTIGTQQAAMASNNIDVTSGTPLDLIEDTATFGELDALMSEYNAEKRALAYEQQAQNFANQANLDIISGKNARTSGYLNAFSSGISGLGNTVSGVINSTGLGGFGSLGRISKNMRVDTGAYKYLT